MVEADLAPISNFSYTYDRVGNRLAKVFDGGQAGESYSYDNLYQVIGVSGDQAHSYQYDPLGNRTTVNGSPYTVNTLNQYSSVGGTSFTYDLNGNLTSDGTYTYSYDYENRLVSAQGSGQSAQYVYDPFGRRIEKSVNGVVTRYLYDGDQILLETTSTGLPQARYTYGAGIDELLTMNRGGNTYYLYHDGLGSVTDVIESGVKVESYSYDPYGQPTIRDGSGSVIPVSAIGNPYLFTGRELDSETGNYYFRARAYHSGIGRFLQRDPITWGPDDPRIFAAQVLDNPAVWPWVIAGLDPGQRLPVSPSDLLKRGILSAGGNFPTLLHPYAYVANNSLNWLDPLGLEREKPWWQKLEEGYYYGTGYGQEAAEWYAQQQIATGNWLWSIPGAISSLWTPQTYQATAWTLVTAVAYTTGFEIKIGNNVRIAPFGNRTGNSTGELPHYHRRIVGPDGKTIPGGGIRWHRPWERGF